MSNPIDPNDILQRILDGTQTDTDVEYLRQWLDGGGIQNFQAGKYNVNIENGQDIHIGDRTYHGLDAEAIREIIISAIKDAEVKISQKSGRENITNLGKMAKEKVSTVAKGTKPSRRPKKSNLEISIEVSKNVRVFYSPRRTEQQTKKALQVLRSIGHGSGQAVRGILFLIGKE